MQSWICLYTFRFAALVPAIIMGSVLKSAAEIPSIASASFAKGSSGREGRRILTHHAWLQPEDRRQNSFCVPRHTMSALGALASPLPAAGWASCLGKQPRGAWLLAAIRMDQPPLILVIALGPYITPQKPYF